MFGGQLGNIINVLMINYDDLHLFLNALSLVPIIIGNMIGIVINHILPGFLQSTCLIIFVF
jgi:hypothetical protein